MSRFNRRDVLKGLGLGLLSLPLLEAGFGRSAYAQVGGPPRRFVVFWNPNGTVPDHWRCSGTENNFTLSRILEPLGPVKKDILVVEGLDALSAYNGPGDAHQRGTGQCLTGRPLQQGEFLGAAGRSSGWADGISVDQAIADHVGAQTKLRSLEVGVHVSGANVNSRISYRGPAQPLPPENDPRFLFDRLFDDPSVDPKQKAERIARRKSVLDTVGERYKRLLPAVGAADRQKLEQHLQAIREIESRLDASGGVCAAPGAPGAVDHTRSENVPIVGKLQMDILVSALSCDLTRVASLMWMNSATEKTFPWLGIHEGHHELAHRGDEDLDAKEKLTRVYQWYASQFAYFVERLASVPEGNGTLLDNTLVVWLSEHSKGNEHDRRDLPYVLAGRAGGQVRPGRLLRLTGEVPHNNLWVSCLNIFGVQTDTFGDPAFCTGRLNGLS
jgi:hypothetical protein